MFTLKNILIIITILLLANIIILLSGGLWRLQYAKDGVAYRINRFTGKTFLIKDDGEYPLIKYSFEYQQQLAINNLLAEREELEKQIISYKAKLKETETSLNTKYKWSREKLRQKYLEAREEEIIAGQKISDTIEENGDMTKAKLVLHRAEEKTMRLSCELDNYDHLSNQCASYKAKIGSAKAKLQEINKRIPQLQDNKSE